MPPTPVNNMPNWLRPFPKEGVVRRAYEFAEAAHRGIARKSGDDYITHSLQVARTVHEWGFDDASVAAALLHDVVEDTPRTLQEIKSAFGEDVASLVSRLTKLGVVKYRPTAERDARGNHQAENIRKFIIAISEDLRVVFIKLADRLHNMQTLSALPHAKQLRIAAETTDIYAPLAYRLGMHSLSGELEDLAFPYLHPEEYEWLTGAISLKYEERRAYAERAVPILQKMLQDAGVTVLTIDARAKRYASLYKKLKKYDMDIGHVYDLVALRVVVPTVADCYAALGVVHAHWPPLPGRFKDYIALPKPNGYRSLHTTVFCEQNQVIEIQFRTWEMHEEAELGAAAYWAYAQAKSSKAYLKRRAPRGESRDLTWVRKLREWSKHFRDPEEFLSFVKTDFLKDRIFVITPKRDVIDLPQGATPVDFAYHVHTRVGHECSGARVNGKLVPLNHELMSGDIIEILTQHGKKPSASWLPFVKTSMARTHIKSALRRRQ